MKSVVKVNFSHTEHFKTYLNFETYLFLDKKKDFCSPTEERYKIGPYSFFDFEDKIFPPHNYFKRSTQIYIKFVGSVVILYRSLAFALDRR